MGAMAMSRRGFARKGDFTIDESLLATPMFLAQHDVQVAASTAKRTMSVEEF